MQAAVGSAVVSAAGEVPCVLCDEGMVQIRVTTLMAFRS